MLSHSSALIVDPARYCGAQRTLNYSIQLKNQAPRLLLLLSFLLSFYFSPQRHTQDGYLYHCFCPCPCPCPCSCDCHDVLFLF
ncbi:hypothetical protein I7I53_10093 [Histoplasma capsulatum var. duboisii H88]|uniref:Uncharacterized protein n=1 Tax=Ajellomyces capsulatus (strain H88) TaxID=544711 RepID=A0A8A1LA51_AJEC8|nr:hypothetical protein I7I53_10093 [Histoplasma capsulatum var. duboisii H88]